ncbi:hypothetical protein PHYC_02358 [Phycisphaerales bacterium]|nr:hypothetical protein PHYC_02358 [Phycisphaerales bacterium]
MVEWRLCPSCGYALRGLVEETPVVTCPECGHRWSTRALRENDLLVPPFPWAAFAILLVVGLGIVVVGALRLDYGMWFIAAAFNSAFFVAAVHHGAKRRHGEFTLLVALFAGIAFGSALTGVELIGIGITVSFLP